MNFGFGCGGFGIKLHAVSFNAHNGADVSGEQDVRNLSKHGVTEVLDHEAHAVGLGPAGAENCSRLGFACFQGDAGPSQFAAQTNHAPVVRAFVEEEGLAARDAADIDRMLLELVGKGLLDVENHSVDSGMSVAKFIENFVNVLRV